MIDRREARELFNNVKRPDGVQEEIDKHVRSIFCRYNTPYSSPTIIDLKKHNQNKRAGETHEDHEGYTEHGQESEQDI